MSSILRVNGQTYEVRFDEIPPARGKGYSAMLRALPPGASVTLNISRANACTLAHRILGKGNYRTWENTDPAIEGTVTIQREYERESSDAFASSG